MENAIALLPNEQPQKYIAMPTGLGGYWWETEDMVCVPFVESYRRGAFSLFLRRLAEKGKVVFFPTIVSAKLEAILVAKDYIPAGVNDKLMGLALVPQESKCKIVSVTVAN